VAIVTTEEALGVYGAIDCGAFIAHFALAAHALGVASIAQASIAQHAPLVRSHFGLPASRLVVCGISFGYEDKTHPANGFRTDRAPLPSFVTWVDA
jgi:nitroreductase